MALVKTRVMLLTVPVLMLSGVARAVIDPNLATAVLIDQHFDDANVFDIDVPLDIDPNITSDPNNPTSGQWIAGLLYPGAVATTDEYWSPGQSMDTRRAYDGTGGFIYGTGQMVGYTDLGSATGVFVVTYRVKRSHTGQETWASIGNKNWLDSLHCGVVLRANNDLRVYRDGSSVPTSIMEVDNLDHTTIWNTSWHQIKVVIDIDGGLGLNPPDETKGTFDVYYSQDGTGDDYVLAVEGVEFTKDPSGILNAVKFSSYTGQGHPVWIDDVFVAAESGGYEGPYVCGDPGTVYLPFDFNKDCRVDLADFALFASTWLWCTDPQDPNCDQYWK